MKLFAWFKRNKKTQGLPPTKPAERTPVLAEPTKAASATQAPSLSSDAVTRKSVAGRRAPGDTESGAGDAKKSSKKK